jgi:hypothetical protein
MRQINFPSRRTDLRDDQAGIDDLSGRWLYL